MHITTDHHDRERPSLLDPVEEEPGMRESDKGETGVRDSEEVKIIIEVEVTGMLRSDDETGMLDSEGGLGVHGLLSSEED
jgi:hypothetical protein